MGTDPTLPALQRLRRYLRSTGRYGPSPFLVGHYGGLGELAQGFCRTSAVGGGIYILGREVASITMIGKDPQTDNGDSHSSPATDSGLRWSLRLEGFDQEVRAATVVTSPDYLPVDLQPKAHLITSPSPATSPRSTFARGIVLIDRPIHFISSGQATSSLEDPDPENEEDNEVTQTSQTNDYIDTALLVFPPSSVDGGSATSSVNVLITGEASMSAPRNHCV